MAGIARMRTIVLDCPDPHTLARFYVQIGGGAPIVSLNNDHAG